MLGSTTSQPSAGYVGAIDQGTSSTRFMVFDGSGAVVARHQAEHGQILPRPGWVEHDPVEIWERTCHCIRSALDAARLDPAELAAIGIANQRETAIVWDRRTGRPYCNALVWQDTRTDPIVAALAAEGAEDLVRERTGLTLASYFSASKLHWILRNVDGVRAAAERGHALFGTVDSWLVWNLTGGEVHATDVTNAGRTMLMDLRTLAWDEDLLELFEVPRAMLPAIRPSAHPTAFGSTTASGPFGAEVGIAAVLGDQQAAMVGQGCFARGDVKNTYGTGNFMLLNTGSEPVRSRAGLLTTVCFQFGDDPPSYALEGSIAVTGAAIQWLRDQLRIIGRAEEIESLAGRVDDTDGIYFVPAFSGLFAPYWRSDARGAIVGLTAYHKDAHLARAALEAICYQSGDVLDAMSRDSQVRLDALKVDGGVTANDLCMQLQADILGIPVIRPEVAETTALGAACAAGLAAGVWRDTDELRSTYTEARRWVPRWSQARRESGAANWRKAVERALGWAEAS